MTELHTIATAGKKEIPQGTKLVVHLGSVASSVTLSVQLPGQTREVIYPDLLIKDGVVTLPVPMVFLSHAKEDADVVRTLTDRLLDDGVITWFDENDLLPGDDWKAKIASAIEVSDFVLVFLSSKSISKTGYFQKEVRHSLEQRDLRPQEARYIIPVLLDDCHPPRPFQDLQWLSLGSEGWYEKLKRAVHL